MSKFIKFIRELFSNDNNIASSKRFVGIISGLSLPIALLLGLSPPVPLINAVVTLSVLALGLATTDKIFNKNKDK